MNGSWNSTTPRPMVTHRSFDSGPGMEDPGSLHHVNAVVRLGFPRDRFGSASSSRVTSGRIGAASDVDLRVSTAANIMVIA